ncbi:Aminotransferase class V/Cysteine desulfurase [Botryosphaeria dothidea]|uniref:Aminotransferase class V/Cysteine desulfurase n=1 Tax=Botryosphaeria dothidea TaxID=55169 RepID=A0A8H4NF85_9PEZI|nr:Aminotransferase class V/Cysteine desulfurase [Botryosphaeria dothidea]
MNLQAGFAPHVYNSEIEGLIDEEYPSLKGVTYLDHGGSAIPAKSLLQHVASDLSTHLYGNPHSTSTPSALAGRRVEEVREQTLRFLGADPQYFDLVFVANATAAMKLVMDSFKDHCEATHKQPRSQRRRFWYGYHRDAHNSLIGVREAAGGGQHCFDSDQEVDDWICGANRKIEKKDKTVRLFGYCGQSNMTGRRLPLSWSSQIRDSRHTADVHVLFDAAALATTTPLDFNNPEQAPDFTCLSFYKMFGFPDLGALVIRKYSPGARILSSRRYFGGGTVDMVTCLDSSTFHAKKTLNLHDHLEDGTLPFHSILALSSAIRTHTRLFTSMSDISAHTAILTGHMYRGLSSLHHANGQPVVTVYNDSTAVYGDSRSQGATIAFNVLQRNGMFVAPSTVEQMANSRNIFIRSGSLCNPGGAARYLGWTSMELCELYKEGLRCSRPSEVIGGRPTGVVRCSLGAVSTMRDVRSLLEFMEEVFVDYIDEGVRHGPTEAGGGTDTTVSVRASAEASIIERNMGKEERNRGISMLVLSCFLGGRGGGNREKVDKFKEP